jgi:diguanylate cyclase (GGDEF)-like protein
MRFAPLSLNKGLYHHVGPETHPRMTLALDNLSFALAFRSVLDAPKKQTITRLRWLIVTIVCYLLLFSEKALIPLDVVHSFALFYVLTNASLYFVKPRVFESITFFGTLVVFDTLALSFSLIVTGQLGSDFYLSYFLIIIIAGFWKDLRWSLGSAILLSLLYSCFLYMAEDLTTHLLLRVPFIFIASVFYGYFVQVVDNEHALREKAEKEARHDFLTGLPNRQAYHERITQETERCRRYGRPMSILMVDIDNFKLVNDSLGHDWGDIVLQKVAAQLSDNLRSLDFVARYGGEEFVIILPETGLTGAIETANRLCSAIKESPVETPRGLLAVTVSIGVSSSSNLVKGVTDHTQMTSDADQALYQAKKSGKDRVGTMCVLEESGPVSVATDQMN